MQANAPSPNWNEIQFLSWKEFRQMAPSILQLEVTRLGGLIRALGDDTEFHNPLVRARFALKEFIRCVEAAQKDTVEQSCAGHLRTAIANISFQPEGLDGGTQETCRYILDRLNYVHHRISLIY